jgi:hypothetical protein
MRGLTRASIEEPRALKLMDCRVKPGNDEGGSASVRTAQFAGFFTIGKVWNSVF